MSGVVPSRDQRFAPQNDRLWGPGNWVRCPTCPRDAEGNEVYHHNDAHPVVPSRRTHSVRIVADQPTTTGPCGDAATVPAVEVRDVDGQVELAIVSDPYCWRVRSWWTPANAHRIAAELIRAADNAELERLACGTRRDGDDDG